MKSIQQQKKELRNKIRSLKKLQSEVDRKMQSGAILAKLEKTALFKKAKTVLLYWSMPDEVHTHDFIEKWRREKTVLLPVVDGDLLKIRQYSGKSAMKPGEQFNIPEPNGPDFDNTSSIDLIIVPGMAFDSQCNRLGRGRGFYDKLLSSANAYKIGICFNYQYVNEVPIEEHDFKMELIIKQ